MIAPARPSFAGTALSRSSSVLLLVDWINPFDNPDAAALHAPARAAAQRVAVLRKRLARAGTQTIYANDNYGVWRSDFRRLLSECRSSSGASRAIARLLTPQRNDIAVVKPRHSAFYETPLQLLLQQLKARELIITGMSTELCVLFTAMDAYIRGYRLRVPEDCVASARPERHAAALAYLSDVLGANIAPIAGDRSKVR
jgi:nicotinamidase-related amidase